VTRIGHAITSTGRRGRRAAILGAAVSVAILLAVPSLAATFNGWAPAHSLGTARLLHVQVTLANGNVLVTGGESGLGGGTGLKSTEIYNPSTDSWSGGSDMGTARVGAVAVRLQSGKVLVAGGSSTGGASADNLNTAEVYDPSTNTWAPTANNMTTARGLLATATLLPSGQVLIAGGVNTAGNSTKSADLYSPSTNSFSVANSMSTPHVLGFGSTLPSGKVIVAAGESASTPSLTVTANSDLYDRARTRSRPVRS
jgi:N-acetylneuraminic acid mutarotase